MARQYSTAVSDAVLVVSAVIASYTVLPMDFAAAIGFSMMAVAACLGTMRFSRDSPSESHVKCHQYMSELTATLGIPLIAAAYAKQSSSILANILRASALAIFLCQQSKLFVNIAEVAAKIIGPVSMLCLLVLSIVNFCGFGVVGVLLFALAALVVKTEGEMLMFKRVDIFHYVLVFANLALMKGLETCNKLPDIYYVPGNK